jgi:hypothetical protein
MQQFCYAGAVVEECENFSQPQDPESGVPPSNGRFGFAEYVERWETVELRLRGMPAADLASRIVEEHLLVVQEMLRRANKAIMSDNVKACYL